MNNMAVSIQKMTKTSEETGKSTIVNESHREKKR